MDKNKASKLLRDYIVDAEKGKLEVYGQSECITRTLALASNVHVELVYSDLTTEFPESGRFIITGFERFIIPLGEESLEQFAKFAEY